MRRFFLLLMACAWCAACAPSESAPKIEPQAAEPVARENVIAQVGSRYLTQQQLNDRVRQLDGDDASFAQSSSGQKLFVQLLVREQLAALDAQAKNLDKSDEYLAALEDKRAQLQEIYQAYAEQLLLHVWEDYLQDSGALSVSDEEIEAYYKKYPYEMTIKQLILDNAQTADEVWRELKSSKNRWKELEKKYSVAPEQSKGKEISFMPGEYIAELEVIAANSSVGSVQGFVKTGQGFHIIMKTGERRLTLQQAAPRIRSVLENQKLDALFQTLQSKYKVTIYEQNN